MNNQSDYLKKSFRKNISAITLGVILLASPSLSFAQGANVNQQGEKQSSQEQTTQAAKVQMINLNKSTFEQLVSLKGVGHTKAQAIIVYRQQAGGFKSVDELIKVSGIGEKIVKDNRKRLSI
jgi:competence protein ComEA